MAKSGSRNHRILGPVLIAGALGLLASPGLTSYMISVHGGTPGQVAMVDWAIGRFETAGLTLPPLEVSFHPAPSGCMGNSGLYDAGRLDVCTLDQEAAYARKTIVHELAHAWIEGNVPAASRARFMRLRGVQSWNDGDQPWGLRGYEQAAEVITWFIGPGLAPLLPDHPDPAALRQAYRALTGMAPPGMQPGF